MTLIIFGKMKLIIVRHGESEANKKGIHQRRKDEWSDTSLSKDGIFQAKQVAERLKDEKIDGIYASDLKRAKETA
jgi:broad specificity phosphatase PhoE